MPARPQPVSLDLNLLSVLVEVVESGSVKAAARRLAITPSAVSHALTRLRGQLGDPLVTRTSEGMRPTERAIELVDAVRPALDEVERAVRHATRFEPASLERTFTIALPGFGVALLVPALLARLAREAPGVRLRITGLPAVPESALAREVDVMIGELPRDSSPALQRRRICSERYACAVRAGHPHRGHRLTLAEYAAAQHIVIAHRGRGGGAIEELLASAGLCRDAVATVEDYVSAPYLVAGTDAVLTAAEGFLRSCAGPLGLRMVELELDLPRIEIAMVWHERSARDPMHRWLRELIAAVASETHGAPL